MQIPFSKYHGAGNDFVIVDNRDEKIRFEQKQIEWLCNRHFGIGADGLMLLQSDYKADFRMIYFNSDGNQSSMCGNGGRCLVAFAFSLGVIGEKTNFQAVDGIHCANVISSDTIALQMTDVELVEELNNGDYLLDTGSPHYVRFVEDVMNIDLKENAHEIRYSDRFAEQGVNVNFVSYNGVELLIRTYERGVEDETLACGTGVTAAAIAAHKKGLVGTTVGLKAVGGDLSVNFEVSTDGYSNVWKTGPVQLVFTGNIDL